MKLALAAVNEVLSTLDVTKKVDKSLLLCAAKAVFDTEAVFDTFLPIVVKILSFITISALNLKY